MNFVKARFRFNRKITCLWHLADQIRCESVLYVAGGWPNRAPQEIRVPPGFHWGSVAGIPGLKRETWGTLRLFPTQLTDNAPLTRPLKSVLPRQAGAGGMTKRVGQVVLTQAKRGLEWATQSIGGWCRVQLSFCIRMAQSLASGGAGEFQREPSTGGRSICSPVAALNQNAR